MNILTAKSSVVFWGFYSVTFFSMGLMGEALAMVECRAISEGRSQLTRLSDGQALGDETDTDVCDQAVEGANAGVVCSLNIYSGRRGFAPTSILRARGTGHSGVSTVEQCNAMIASADRLVFCSYSGTSLGWKTTRSYDIPAEPARYPHRFGASSPSLPDCQRVAAGSLVIWETDRLVHQTCRWGGEDWYPTCASNPRLSFQQGWGSVDTCLAAIQEPHRGCWVDLDEELVTLRDLTE